MTREPVKQFALIFFSCEVADPSAFGCVFPELFDLRQIVLHHRRPASCPKSRSGNKRESIAPRPVGTDPTNDPVATNGLQGLMRLRRPVLSGPLAQTACEQSGAGIFMNKFGSPIGGHAPSFNWSGVLLVSSVGYRADGKTECD
jgi:hypothetical protein